MSRNGLYTLIGVLAIALVGLVGWYIYDQSQQPQLQINVGKSGISVSGHG